MIKNVEYMTHNSNVVSQCTVNSTPANLQLSCLKKGKRYNLPTARI